MKEKKNGSEFKIKDLITFLEMEEEKARSALGKDKNFKELGIKRAAAFRQISERLELHYPDIIVTDEKKEIILSTDELNRSTLAGKFGAMFVYALTYMKQVGISKRKREIYKDVHRQIRELILREPRQQKPKIDKGWLPTAENINALPDPIREYIHDIEMNADPAGMVQNLAFLKDTVKQLEAKIEWEKPGIDEKYIRNKIIKIRAIFTLNKGQYYSLTRDCKEFITQIISDARGLQVPVVKIKPSRIKPERMDYMDKGAKFGKSKSGVEDEKFPFKCCEKCNRLIKQFACKGVFNAIECLYLLSKMKIKKKGD